MNKKDYYEVLGVTKSATGDEIKNAYRKLAKKYHPDVSKEENASDKFKEAQEAYSILSDDSKRKQYDQFGHQAFNQQGGYGNGASGFDFNGFDFSDIFGDVFGGGFGSSRSSNRPRKGQDTLVHVNLTFEEAVFGTKKEINITLTEDCDSCSGIGGFGEHTCNQCRGSGFVNVSQQTIFGSFATRTTCPTCRGKGKTYDKVCDKCRGNGKVRNPKKIEVVVPSGVDNENQLRLHLKGEAGINGGPNGDLYVEFVVSEHPIYKRDDNDIYLTLPISITDAVLGCKKDVPTIYGKVKLTIPAGSNSGDKHRLKGKGIKGALKNRVGDMYVILDIITPSTLTKEQKQLFDELSKTNLSNHKAFETIKKYL